jgi:hypothetical protein
MPRLAKCEPTTPLQDFVLNALKAEGVSIENQGQGVFRATSARLGEERFTFDQAVWEEHSSRGVFMGRVPLLYQPGKPAFERLVQRWIDRSAARIEDGRSVRSEFAVRAESWLATVPEARLCDVNLTKRINKFTGSLVCRTRVSNAIDSYERLLRVPCSVDGGLSESAFEMDRPVNAGLLTPQMEHEITQAVNTDADVGHFRQYYEARLQAELKKTERGSRRDKLMNDLRPSVTSEVSAVEGRFTDTITLAIKYEFDGSPQYESQVRFEADKIVSTAHREKCQVTGLEFPTDCLAKCEVTGSVALRHKLEESQHSGKLGLPDMLGLCEQTGKRALVTELETCGITKRRVLQDELVQSQMSGRRALASHTTRCEFTGATILEDEVSTSGHSQRRFRSDEAIEVHPSGMIVHRTEAIECAYSQRWYLADDCVLSDVTGQPAFKVDVRYSEKSGRKCHKSEIKFCAHSGIRLLPDEVGQSDFTGHFVDKDLLLSCPDTRKRGLKSQFATCEVTGELVAPEALGQCAVTNVKARRSLLSPSDVSGRLALSERLVTCEASGTKLLPNEASRCKITGKLVDVRLLKRCSKSGTVALANEMVQSSVSGKWMLRKYATKLLDGACAARDEATFCNWQLGFLPNKDIATCSLSGLTFTKRYMNPSSEFITLRQCLDGELDGSPFPDPAFLARLLPDIFGKVKSFRWRSATHGQTHILFGRKSSFGIIHSWFAVLAHGDLNGLQLRGKVLFGKRAKGIWTLTESHDIDKT